MLSRAAFLASAAAVADHFGWAPGERWLACMPLAHVGGFSILIRSLAARRCAALAGGFDADRLPEWISRRRITLLSLVPTMLKRLLDAHPAWAPPAHLRCVVLGGAAAPPKLIDQASRRRIPLVLTYGLTEACSQVTATAYEDRFAPPMDHAGTPLSNVSLRIQEGRVQIRGPVVMSGYLGQPELPPDSWFDTGDLGELDALGRLHIHARRTDLIVRGGENVYPAEVERVLESFPGVLAAGVFGVPDEVWGQTVAAALVCDARTSPLAPSVAAFCAAHLAPFKCPRRICFVSALPQTAAGKLDRAGLARFAEQ
jgi:O-succinylbenzoic acid--CoA ligase